MLLLFFFPSYSMPICSATDMQTRLNCKSTSTLAHNQTKIRKYLRKYAKKMLSSTESYQKRRKLTKKKINGNQSVGKKRKKEINMICVPTMLVQKKQMLILMCAYIFSGNKAKKFTRQRCHRIINISTKHCASKSKLNLSIQWTHKRNQSS